jgi:hypothetical protein
MSSATQPPLSSEQIQSLEQFASCVQSIAEATRRLVEIDAALSPYGIRFDWEEKGWFNQNGRIWPKTVLHSRLALTSLIQSVETGWAHSLDGYAAFDHSLGVYVRITPILVTTEGNLSPRELLGTSKPLRELAHALSQLEQGMAIIINLQQDIRAFSCLESASVWPRVDGEEAQVRSRPIPDVQ